ncbi:MAG: hypothetical protein SGJ03_11415 [Alphaproteobacteria bacterium]|nr:hypothetical protein [Alphaproteobacteria bacterium]
MSTGLVVCAGLWSVRQIGSEILKVQTISTSLSNQNVIEGMNVAILHDVILSVEDADKARMNDDFNAHARSLLRASQLSHFLNLAAGARVDTKLLETRAKELVGEARAIIGSTSNNSQNSNNSYSRLFDRAKALSTALEPASAELMRVSRGANEQAAGAVEFVERMQMG